MTILGLDIFSTNGELLTSVDGDTFTMLDEDVVVKVYAGGNDRTCNNYSNAKTGLPDIQGCGQDHTALFSV